MLRASREEFHGPMWFFADQAKDRERPRRLSFYVEWDPELESWCTPQEVLKEHAEGTFEIVLRCYERLKFDLDSGLYSVPVLERWSEEYPGVAAKLPKKDATPKEKRAYFGLEMDLRERLRDEFIENGILKKPGG
jgi:hypothetical protein